MRRATILAFCFTSWSLAACAAILGLPDPTLDETVGPNGQDSGTSDAAGGDSTSTDAPTTDAPIVVDGGCDLTMPFTKVEALDVLNSSDNEIAPTLTADELRIVFVRLTGADSGAQPTTTFFVARRPNRTAAFSTPEAIPGGSSFGLPDFSPCLSGDGAYLFFSRIGGPTGQSVDVWKTFGVDGGYATDAALPEQELANGAKNELCGSLAPDNAMYLSVKATDVAGGFADGVYRAPWDAAARAFERPSILTIATDASLLNAPTISADELTLFLAIQGDPNGPSDIFVTKRSALDASFGPPTKVTELSTPLNETPGWLSRDGCRLYFSSSGRDAGAGRGGEIYVATRGP